MAENKGRHGNNRGHNNGSSNWEETPNRQGGQYNQDNFNQDNYEGRPQRARDNAGYQDSGYGNGHQAQPGYPDQQRDNANFNRMGSSYGAFSGTGLGVQHGRPFESGQQYGGGYGGTQYAGRTNESFPQQGPGHDAPGQNRYNASSGSGAQYSAANGQSPVPAGNNAPNNFSSNIYHSGNFNQLGDMAYGAQQTPTGNLAHSNQTPWGASFNMGNHRGKGPKGYQRSDSRISEDINDRLCDDPHIDASGIQVSVENCEVTLSGTVDSRNAKRHAEDIAESISGVKNVENRLRINHEKSNGGTFNGSNPGTSQHSAAPNGESKPRRNSISAS
ncbi:MAG: BON domain-containing protein [Bacteroidota bacterium]